MLSSPTEKQVPIGDSAEEADLLRRSKKKTKRGLSEREDADMEIEEDGRNIQGNRGPFGDKYGSWMIANRKSRTYQNSEDTRRNSGKNQGGRKEIPKGKSGGNQGNKYSNFNKEGCKIWNNSRFGALQNLEDETEDEAQEETNPMDRPDGPIGALLSAETESHTVVRGYDKGNRVVRTMITEEGSTMEEVQTLPEGGDHHQDPPDSNSLEASDGPGDLMAGVEFTEGPSSSGLGVVLQ
nr:uncharacterized protein LOC109158743 [Ipomoea batatas]